MQPDHWNRTKAGWVGPLLHWGRDVESSLKLIAERGFALLYTLENNDEALLHAGIVV